MASSGAGTDGAPTQPQPGGEGVGGAEEKDEERPPVDVIAGGASVELARLKSAFLRTTEPAELQTVSTAIAQRVHQLSPPEQQYLRAVYEQHLRRLQEVSSTRAMEGDTGEERNKRGETGETEEEKAEREQKSERKQEHEKREKRREE